jgi:hypothetical protein
MPLEMYIKKQDIKIMVATLCRIYIQTALGWRILNGNGEHGSGCPEFRGNGNFFGITVDCIYVEFCVQNSLEFRGNHTEFRKNTSTILLEIYSEKCNSSLFAVVGIASFHNMVHVQEKI